GVFQIESRAQMATLPRLKPKCFYDVVIEVAIIRPGPIQGDMVHPYLARRAGKEAVTYFDERLKPVLERTLGVPLFQEQMLKFAILAYGSAYLKAHRPAEFYASLINNQPMGFYTPATIVKDARRHGVKVKPVCVAQSEWNCTVMADDAIRLGFCVVNGLQREHADDFLRERKERSFSSLEDFRKRALLTKDELRALANLGALNCFAEHRRAAMWKVEETPHDDLLTERGTLESAGCHPAVCGSLP